MEATEEPKNGRRVGWSETKAERTIALKREASKNKKALDYEGFECSIFGENLLNTVADREFISILLVFEENRLSIVSRGFVGFVFQSEVILSNSLYRL